MRILALLSLSIICALAAETQRPLDGNQPADALQILAILAGEAPLKINESEQRRTAILTLQAVVQRDAAAQAEAAKAALAAPAKPAADAAQAAAPAPAAPAPAPVVPPALQAPDQAKKD